MSSSPSSFPLSFSFLYGSFSSPTARTSWIWALETLSEIPLSSPLSSERTKESWKSKGSWILSCEMGSRAAEWSTSQLVCCWRQQDSNESRLHSTRSEMRAGSWLMIRTRVAFTLNATHKRIQLTLLRLLDQLKAPIFSPSPEVSESSWWLIRLRHARILSSSTSCEPRAGSWELGVGNRKLRAGLCASKWACQAAKMLITESPAGYLRSFVQLGHVCPLTLSFN